ncbi:Solute carrier family 40 member 2, partial [Mucuna pruriens]
MAFQFWGQSNHWRMTRLTQSDQQSNNPTLEEDSLPSVTSGSTELANRKCSKILSEKISDIPYIAAWKLPFLDYSSGFAIFHVLSFGMLMTTALEWEGIPAYVIGPARGISAWTCLRPCIAAIWIQNGFLSSYILMGSVAISRLGLWMFDLSDLVPESDRLIVGGVQNSLHH